METESFRRWDELIPDALGLIFKNLPFQQVLTVIPRVCKSWHRAVEGPYCWQVIDIDEWSTQCGPKQLDRMLRLLINRTSGSFRELHVSCVNDYQTFSFIAENAGSLRTLSFQRSEIGDSIVEQVASKLSNLTSLDLSYCCNISTWTFKCIGRNCKSLRSLSWNMHPLYTSDKKSSRVEEVRAISQTMPRLKQLGIAYLNIDTPSVHEIIRGCPELESLDLRGCWAVKLDKKALEEKHPGLKVLGPMVMMGYFESLDDCSDCSDDWRGEDDDDSDGYTYDGLDDWMEGVDGYEYEDLEAYFHAEELEMRLYEGVEPWDEIFWPASP